MKISKLKIGCISINLNVLKYVIYNCFVCICKYINK